MKRIELPPLRGQQDACWQALLGMAGRFGTGWMLIGGQMVLVHQLAAEADGLPQAQYRFSASVNEKRLTHQGLTHQEGIGDRALVGPGEPGGAGEFVAPPEFSGHRGFSGRAGHLAQWLLADSTDAMSSSHIGIKSTTLG